MSNRPGLTPVNPALEGDSHGGEIPQETDVNGSSTTIPRSTASPRFTLRSLGRRRPSLTGIWRWRFKARVEDPVIDPAVRELLEKLEPTLPDLVAAVRNGRASFDDLTDAYEGRDTTARNTDQKALRSAYNQIYPYVRQTFVIAHGELIDLYPSSRIQAYAAITRPSRNPRRLSNDLRPGFHFVYDLASAPVAGEMFSRIMQLAYDAKRIVPLRVLPECLDQLFSATTDLLGILEEHSDHTDRNRELERIAIVQRDLDQVELRYLQITARLWYFLGALCGTGVALLGTFLIGTGASVGSVAVTAIMFSAVGATLSVVQKMSDDTLTVRYVVGPFYLWFLGLARPVIGAFAGFLLQLAMIAGLIPLSLIGAPGQAYVLLSGFAIGWAERSIPDIFSRAGFSRGLPSASSSSTSSYGQAPGDPKTPGPERPRRHAAASGARRVRARSRSSPKRSARR